MSTPLVRATKSRELAFSVLDRYETLYVNSRLLGNPPVVAARMAGFKKPEAKALALEEDLRVREAIEVSIRLGVYQQELTRQDVLNGFQDALNMASTATEVTAAWREIGRMIGAYEPVKVEHIARTKRELEQMDDTRLAELAAIEGEYELVEFDEDREEVEGLMGVAVVGQTSYGVISIESGGSSYVPIMNQTGLMRAAR